MIIIIFPLRKRRWAQSIMLRRKKGRKVGRRNNLDTEGAQMADNHNSCSEAAATVGTRERLTMTMTMTMMTMTKIFISKKIKITITSS